MSLAQSTATQTIFNFLQQVQTFVFGTLVNIIIINALPREEYAVIGIAAGYYVILTWVAISPENILSQRYRSLRQQYQSYLPQIFTFTLLKLAALALISIGVATAIFFITHNSYISLIFVAYAITQLIILFSNLVQFLLKLEYQQQVITKYTSFIRGFEVLMLLTLFIWPHAYLVTTVMAITAALEIFLLTRRLRQIEAFPFFAPLRPTLQTIWEHIRSYSLWHHLGTNLIKYMYEIDTVFLSLWASLTVVGNYAVAMKIANFSFIIPSLIQMNAGLMLTRIESIEKQNRALSLFLKYSAAAAILQLIAFVFLGKLYIGLHTQDFVDDIYLYSTLIFIGTTVLNIVRPLISYINAFTSTKDFFLRSVVPSAIFTTIVYPLSAYYYGAVGLAIGNIICYSFWVMTILFYMRRTSFRFSFTLLDHQEKILIAQSITKLKKRYAAFFQN